MPQLTKTFGFVFLLSFFICLFFGSCLSKNALLYFLSYAACSWLVSWFGFVYQPKTNCNCLRFWFILSFKVASFNSHPSISFFLSSLDIPFKNSSLFSFQHHPLLFTPSCWHTSRLLQKCSFRGWFSRCGFENVVPPAERDVFGYKIVSFPRSRLFVLGW